MTSLAVTWSDRGNPIGWCAWCRESHEYTVKVEDNAWACEWADAIEQVMIADLREAIDRMDVERDTEESGMSVEKTEVTQLQVEIPDPDPVEGFEPWVDRVRMVWYPHVDPPTAVGGWWELTGQNMGPGILIVHPYQIEALIELLQAAREDRP